MLYVAQFSSKPGKPYLLRFGHSFIKIYFEPGVPLAGLVEYPSMRSQVLYNTSGPSVSRLLDIRPANRHPQL